MHTYVKGFGYAMARKFEPSKSNTLDKVVHTLESQKDGLIQHMGKLYFDRLISKSLQKNFI